MMASFGVMSFLPSQAQTFHLPNTPDVTVASNITNVKNTGTAGADDSIQAVVWDGNKPGLAVYSHKATPQLTTYDFIYGSAVVDPDVVIDPVTGTNIMVVYELHGVLSGGVDIVYEYFLYSASTNSITNIQGPTRLNAASDTDNLTPNVDVSPEGYTAVVWHDRQNNVIRFDGGDDLPNFVAPISKYYEASQQGCWGSGHLFSQPDVAIYKDASKVNHQISAVFRYIEPSFVSNYIVVSKFGWNQYDTITPIYPCFIDTLDEQELSVTHLLQPRISTMWPYTPADSTVYNAVWLHDGQTTFENKIKSRTRDWSSGSLQPIEEVTLTSSSNLRIYPNQWPVTTFAGDFIFNAWDYNDAGIGQVRNSEEALLRQLDLMGTPFYSDDYSVIPENPSAQDDYKFISIDARFVAEGHYAFWNSSTNDVQIKRSDIYNQNLRKGKPESETLTAQNVASTFSVFPNPATDFVIIQGMKNIDDLRLMNLQGQPIAVIVNQLDNTQWQLELGTLPAGIYTLLLNQAGKSTRHKVVVIR
jgi:hypothetical protein